MAFCDLHIHSYFSDGTCSPAQLLQLAQQLQLSAVAMCDHNTVSGLDEFMKAGENSPVEAVPGVEFSTQYGETELHILGLFIRPEAYAVVTEVLENFLRAKEKSNLVLIQKLHDAGIVLDYKKIQSQSGEYVNRAVIGAEMTRLGYVPSVKDAFKRYLSVECGFYVPPRRPDAYETIRFIKSIGAVAVLAHPFLNLDESGLLEFLPEAVHAGLDGMEVYYSKFTAEDTALAQKIAKQFNLLPSGGSDYHGDNKPDIQLGVGRGDLQIPDSWLAQLRKRAKS